MARIVDTDNFGGDYPNEKFVLWPLPWENAQRIADILNDSSSGPSAPRYFKVVNDNYKLQPGFEP
jgi:hypothetical protein